MSVLTVPGALERLTPLYTGTNCIAVVCMQWGDTGKGKFVDVLAGWADIIARGTGGANAGHTVYRGSKKFVFHIIPCGILFDAQGKTTVIGSGCAVHPMNVLEEMEMLQREGLTFDHLLIAMNAKLVLPQHILRDRYEESKRASGRIGTTGRGMGPVYGDHYTRTGLVINDLLNPATFRKKLLRNLEANSVHFRDADPLLLGEILQHPHLGSGRFFNYYGPCRLDVDAIVEYYLGAGAQLERYIAETDRFVWRSHKEGKNILLEGAQGNMLSVDVGTQPYVTASDSSRTGLARGVGLKERHIGRTLGIVKVPYMTRVGGGPFPTEIGGEQSEKWCNDPAANKDRELELYPNASVNSADEFEQGVGIRQVGDEYGATTQRPRRTGWLDLPLIRYSKRHTGRNVILTKPDVMDEARVIRICEAYEYNGPDYRFGQELLRRGSRILEAKPDSEVLRHCRPLYREFPGWETCIRQVRSYDALPAELRRLVEFIEKSADVNVVALSVGPEPDQTILVHAPV